MGESDNERELAQVLYEYAMLFKEKEEDEKARVYFEKALRMFEEMGMERNFEIIRSKMNNKVE